MEHPAAFRTFRTREGAVRRVEGDRPGSGCRAGLHSIGINRIEGIYRQTAGVVLEAGGLITLTDKGYQGSTYAKIPYKGKNRSGSQKEANRAHARLRSPGERANAQLKTWHMLRKLRCCP
jgi:DDE superfamily endonuclease